jgi:hypothetical protein
MRKKPPALDLGRRGGELGNNGARPFEIFDARITCCRRPHPSLLYL